MRFLIITVTHKVDAIMTSRSMILCYAAGLVHTVLRIGAAYGVSGMQIDVTFTSRGVRGEKGPFLNA
ncbi:hypothetical protein ADILRU_2010 [Leifsonia rubra CMS 76R]|nr:hypothetical protein ADILRU_2010 [Leifsonia rubra CMS 76R]